MDNLENKVVVLSVAVVATLISSEIYREGQVLSEPCKRRLVINSPVCGLDEMFL